jgi:hypothetical protein
MLHNCRIWSVQNVTKSKNAEQRCLDDNLAGQFV